jgi:hypothetical protein
MAIIMAVAAFVALRGAGTACRGCVVDAAEQSFEQDDDVRGGDFGADRLT